MKENYEKPEIEIIEFSEAEIMAGSSTMDVTIDDWFE